MPRPHRAAPHSHRARPRPPADPWPPIPDPCCKQSDYAPVNPSLSIESLNALEQALIQAEQEELRLQKALATARDTAATAAWALRNSIMSAKASVLAQYGPNSNAIQSLGLKKKSDRRRPTRRNGADVP